MKNNVNLFKIKRTKAIGAFVLYNKFPFLNPFKSKRSKYFINNKLYHRVHNTNYVFYNKMIKKIYYFIGKIYIYFNPKDNYYGD